MAKRGTGHARYSVVKTNGARDEIWARGRDRWALYRLIHAGREGSTPITYPGPRWSAYVFNLRKMGVQIETLHEPHAGNFPGLHARYVLRCTVVQIDGREDR